MSSGPQLYSRQEAADRLSVSLSTLTRMCAAGHLQTVRIGRSVRIPRDSVVAYIQGAPARPHDARAADAPSLSTWPPTPSLLGELDPGAEQMAELERTPHLASCRTCSWSEDFPTWSEAGAGCREHAEFCPDAVTDCKPARAAAPS